MAQYVGILDGAGDVWGIRIPDFPGCHGGGATPEAALADAIGALRETASHYVDNGRDVPAPRSMEQVRRDKAAEYDPASESLVMVPLVLDRARPVRANISMDAGTLEAIDEEAEKRGLTRSSFLASAAMDKIGAYSSGETGLRGVKSTKLQAARGRKGRVEDLQSPERARSADTQRKRNNKT